MGEAQFGKRVLVESVRLQEEVQDQKRKLNWIGFTSCFKLNNCTCTALMEIEAIK